MSGELALLGLARRAGKLAIGEAAAAQAAADHKAKLILLACDAGEHTRRHMLALATRKRPVAELSQDKAALGESVGFGPCAAVAVLDLDLAAAQLGRLAAAEPGRFDEACAALSARGEKARRRREDTRRHGKKANRASARTGAPSGGEPDRSGAKKEE